VDHAPDEDPLAFRFRMGPVAHHHRQEVEAGLLIHACKKLFAIYLELRRKGGLAGSRRSGSRPFPSHEKPSSRRAAEKGSAGRRRLPPRGFGTEKPLTAEETAANCGPRAGVVQW